MSYHPLDDLRARTVSLQEVAQRFADTGRELRDMSFSIEEANLFLGPHMPNAYSSALFTALEYALNHTRPVSIETTDSLVVDLPEIPTQVAEFVELLDLARKRDEEAAAA